MTAYKVAGILYISDELIQDAQINIIQFIVSLFSDAISDEIEKVIAQGTGVGQPTGLASCTISSTTVGVNLTFDHIIDLIYSLPSKYRAKACFLINDANVKELRKIKDTTNRYIWVDNPVPGQPNMIHGYAVHSCPWISESEIYFGRFDLGYWLGLKGGMSVVISNIAGDAWLRDQHGIRTTMRLAGNCVLENAIRKLISIP